MTEFEKFKAAAGEDITAYREKETTRHAFELAKTVEMMEQLQIKMSGYTLIHMFGEQLGLHLWEKFTSGHNRNVISWLNSLTKEYRFYILHQLRNDPYIFIH